MYKKAVWSASFALSYDWKKEESIYLLMYLMLSSHAAVLPQYTIEQYSSSLWDFFKNKIEINATHFNVVSWYTLKLKKLINNELICITAMVIYQKVTYFKEDDILIIARCR